MNKTLKTALLAAALSGAGTTVALADEAASTPAWGTVTGSVAFTTNYNFRGFSQTNDDPALQGSLTYTHPTGIYLYTWMSNVDFNTPSTDVGAHLEIDLGGGISNNIGKWHYDLGFTYYLYPGANDNNTATKTAAIPELNYYEFYAKGGYDFGVAQVLASVYGSPNNFGKTGAEVYYNGNVTVPLPFLPWNASLSGWVGYQTFLDDDKKGALVDYIDYSVGAGFVVPYGNIALDFRWVGTDMNTSECGLNTCKGTFIFTATKSF